MTEKTCLNARHRELGARMVDFGGWDMPLNYGSQLDEHHAVRREAGMFDVSHMTVVDITGEQVRPFLRRLLANAIDKLKTPGKALYSCMLNERGGVIDDLIVYFLDEKFFRMVVNAATREKDLAWIAEQARAFDVAIRQRPDLAMLAVQGPLARERVFSLLDSHGADAAGRLTRFAAAEADTRTGQRLFLARTGYTGEDGFEIIVSETDAVELWDQLLGVGVTPCGLGARDTLRLEAGMSLYGQDMDETVTPLESGLGWTVNLDGDRDFIGRPALEAQQSTGVPAQVVGLVMDQKGVLRHGQKVITGNGEGEILSGTFSPTLSCAIALARVPAGDPGAVRVDIRGRDVPVRVVKFPFVRNGQAQPGVLAEASR